jgi:signal transduction histidine kinase
MKRKLMLLAEQYLVALRKHLRQAAGEGSQPALSLGRQTVALGLDALQLARVHDQALATLGLSNDQNGQTKRAEMFFSEALTPIVETHRAAQQSKMDLHRLNVTLDRRTLELAVTNRQLQRGIIRRKSVEGALKKSGIRYTKLLKDSLRLQAALRELTHRLLTSQEEERKKISLELQTEIAQTLLGINFRLLTLRKEAKVNSKVLKNEIACTQRLVAKSAQSVRRVARQFRNA